MERFKRQFTFVTLFRLDFPVYLVGDAVRQQVVQRLISLVELDLFKELLFGLRRHRRSLDCRNLAVDDVADLLIVDRREEVVSSLGSR